MEMIFDSLLFVVEHLEHVPAAICLLVWLSRLHISILATTVERVRTQKGQLHGLILISTDSTGSLCKHKHGLDLSVHVKIECSHKKNQ